MGLRTKMTASKDNTDSLQDFHQNQVVNSKFVFLTKLQAVPLLHREVFGADSRIHMFNPKPHS